MHSYSLPFFGGSEFASPSLEEFFESDLGIAAGGFSFLGIDDFGDGFGDGFEGDFETDLWALFVPSRLAATNRPL